MAPGRELRVSLEFQKPWQSQPPVPGTESKSLPCSSLPRPPSPPPRLPHLFLFLSSESAGVGQFNSCLFLFPLLMDLRFSPEDTGFLWGKDWCLPGHFFSTRLLLCSPADCAGLCLRASSVVLGSAPLSRAVILVTFPWMLRGVLSSGAWLSASILISLIILRSCYPCDCIFC